MGSASEEYLIRGVAATTHVDLHGERITKEALEQAARDFPGVQLMFWNHETTIPPIGFVTKTWVEERQDGEFQLAFEGHFLEEGEEVIAPYSDVNGLEVTWEALKEILDSTVHSSLGHLTIRYDPRNLQTDQVTATAEAINDLVNARTSLYIRKAEVPQPVIWLVVGYIGGNIASGFLSRFGEMAAERLAELARGFYDKLSAHLSDLVSQAKPHDKRPDIIFQIPFPECTTVVEGVLEAAEPDNIRTVLETIPLLYARAKLILDRNPPHFFLHMSFLFNPETKAWEINYLVTKSNNIIKGPRYYLTGHPLRDRYERIREQWSPVQEPDSSA